MSTNVTITRKFNPSSGNEDFFTEVGDCDPAFVEALGKQFVNLSRGNNRQYALTHLSAHNGSGANWKDGRSIHTTARRTAYLNRCDTDIAAAVEAAKATFAKAQTAMFSTTPTVVASVSCS